MSPAVLLTTDNMAAGQSESFHQKANCLPEGHYRKGVKYLCEKGIKKVPNKYTLPILDRPNTGRGALDNSHESNLKLPIIDFVELQWPNRSQAPESLADACERYGFFQLVNHGVASDAITSMTDVCERFFEQPFEERAKRMSPNMSAYRIAVLELKPCLLICVFVLDKVLSFFGKSHEKGIELAVYVSRQVPEIAIGDPGRFHQIITNLVEQRLRLLLERLSEAHLPALASPCQMPFLTFPRLPRTSDGLLLRKSAVAYPKKAKYLFFMLMETILESLGLWSNSVVEEADSLKEFEDGSQLMIVNCYPPCPEHDLTLGLPPHSDYGFLTLLLQDEVEGLKIQFEETWVTVEPIPNAFVVNVRDHLEVSFLNQDHRHTSKDGWHVDL
ncbi:hypothetical protein Nepgr_011707 [Nepenthes gracilis]|uniref:Fe2OG dioxygenase domain-containing protein n=1 Tax=Nepenthes gracilis TaxID=150966 RepID=A0AAD3SG51_NEPGR|nr:hypothetical protein Nepgr_011707 [Nepenthes gracilis]